jgi:carbonic anhydrase
MTSTGPGDLFVHRCVGNLIPKCSADGASTGDVSEASAVEYAVGVLNIKHILVCGHSNCGAMKALHNGRENLRGLPNLSQWLVHGEPARILLKDGDPKRFTSKLSELDQLSQANVLTQMDHLMSYPSVRERLAAGSLTVHGAWFQIESAEMYFYKAETERFVKLDEAELARVISFTN